MADVPDEDYDDGYLDWYREPPSEEELHGIAFDPANSPPEGWEVMSDAQRRELLGDDRYPDDPDEDARPEVLDAGFTHGCPAPGATGFAAGGLVDQMLPGADLAWHAGMARQRGLGTLDDDQLVGFLGAARRLGSWAAALEHEATAELDARRAGPDGREGEHVAAELAAALTLTGRSAQAQLDLSRQLERLPQTAALLAAGIIDRPRVLVITAELALLAAGAAAEVENLIAPRAGAMTTGRLRAACQRAVLACDPQAAIRRREQAEKDARVECWAEAAGTAALAGRDLDRARAITADKTLDADARWLQQHGVAGSLEQLRVEAFLARLNGQPVDIPAAPGPRRSELATRPGPTAPGPGGPGTPGVWPPAFGGPASTAASAAAGAAGPAAPGGTPPGPGSTAAGGWPPATGAPGPGPVTGAAGSGPGVSGVNVIVPWLSWLELSDTPGEITGTGAAGPADAPTCRTIADGLATNPATRWSVTITDPSGRPVAYGRARAGPGPPGPARRAWLTAIKLTPIAAGTCGHPNESAGYRPSNRLRNLVKTRSRRCGFPGCRRPAWRCDDDHTIPHDQGGQTCECNLSPLCRQTPPNQASRRLAPRPAPARPPGLDHPQRTPLHHHPRALPGLTGGAQPPANGGSTSITQASAEHDGFRRPAPDGHSVDQERGAGQHRGRAGHLPVRSSSSALPRAAASASASVSALIVSSAIPAASFAAAQ